MPLFDSKHQRNRALILQAVIIVVLGLLYEFGVPMIEQARARATRADRETKITDFFQAAAVPAGDSGAKRLRLTPPVEEVETQLGAPDRIATGYGGTQILTWVGTAHKLEASFNSGQLYALTMLDIKTGHGEQVLQSSAQWRRL